MELIEIVDEKGNFTGQIIDKEEAHDKNLIHNEVAIFIINDKGQVLMQKRSANKRFHPNKWALCAGHVDAYEPLEDAAIREINEELGIDVSLNDLHSFGERKISLSDTNSHITYFYYLVNNMEEDEFVIQESELSEVKWFLIDEFVNMIITKHQDIFYKENMVDRFLELKNINN